MTRFARATTTTAVAVTLAAAMHGCGSTEVNPAGEPTSTPTLIPWSPSPEQYRSLTQQELVEVLLDLSDLPANYIEAPSAPDWLNRKFCNENRPHVSAAQASASHVNDRGRPGEVIRTAIWQYATREEATASFEALIAAAEGCRQETAGGHTYRYAVAQLPAGNMYRTIAIRVTAGGTTTLQGFVKAGPALVTVEMGGLTPANESRNGMTAAAHDGGRLVQLLEKQVDHYKNAAGCARCS